MVESEYAVELVELFGAEEAVGGEGAVGEDAVGLSFVDDGHDDTSVEVAYDAVVAGMWVECEDGDFGACDAEVALEALVEECDLLEEEVVGESRGYVFEGEVVGDDTYTYAVTDHEHKGGGAELVREVFGVAGEVEIRGLYVAFVDGSCDEDVDFAFL